LNFRVKRSGFRIQGLGFRVKGVRYKDSRDKGVRYRPMVQGQGQSDEGLGFEV